MVPMLNLKVVILVIPALLVSLQFDYCHSFVILIMIIMIIVILKVLTTFVLPGQNLKIYVKDGIHYSNKKSLLVD